MTPLSRAFPPAFQVDLTEFDLAPALRLLHGVGTHVTSVAKDATYTAVGLGVLGFQKAQVRRREIQRALQR
jgi:hypothetical protein